MRGVDFVFEDGDALHADAEGHAASLGLLQDALAHAAQEIHRLANLVLRFEDLLLHPLRHSHAQPLDETHRLLAAARREGENHAARRDLLLLAQLAVFLQELDHRLRVVDGLRDEPLHAELRLLHQRLVLVALLDVSLRDGHAAVRALRALVQLGGHGGDGGAAVLVGGGGAADEVIRVDAVVVDGSVEPRVESAGVRLGDALVHDGLLAGDVAEHLGEVGGVVELAEGERAGLGGAALLLLDVVHDEPVGGESGAALDEFPRRLAELLGLCALQGRSQACGARGENREG